jgi:hypothetical protein
VQLIPRINFLGSYLTACHDVRNVSDKTRPGEVFFFAAGNKTTNHLIDLLLSFFSRKSQEASKCQSTSARVTHRRLRFVQKIKIGLSPSETTCKGNAVQRERERKAAM